MITNTLHLMHSLRTKGGTVHQVAKSTGLTVSEILDLHLAPVANVIAYDHGLKAARLDVVDVSGYAYNTCDYKPERISFWRGVLDAYSTKYMC